MDNAKEMLFAKMRKYQVDQSEDALEELRRKILLMSWAERLSLYGELCVAELQTIKVGVDDLTSNPVNTGAFIESDGA